MKNKLHKGGKLTLNIAARANSTRNQNLQLALAKAIGRKDKNTGKSVKTKVAFNVQNHLSEPLLNVADYFCWSVQRIFERGEVRYYNFLKDKISLVVDLYDWTNYAGNKNYYNSKNPLTASNKL